MKKVGKEIDKHKGIRIVEECYKENNRKESSQGVHSNLHHDLVKVKGIGMQRYKVASRNWIAIWPPDKQTKKS